MGHGAGGAGGAVVPVVPGQVHACRAASCLACWTGTQHAGKLCAHVAVTTCLPAPASPVSAPAHLRCSHQHPMPQPAS